MLELVAALEPLQEGLSGQREEQREAYRHVPVDLSESRYYFLNTLFALSGSCLFAQLVDLYDQHLFPHIHGYHDLFERILGHVDQTHVEGTLKTEITADPETYVELDAEAPLALLDQLHSGKPLMLISNAEWPSAVVVTGVVQMLVWYIPHQYLDERIGWDKHYTYVPMLAGAARVAGRWPIPMSFNTGVMVKQSRIWQIISPVFTPRRPI